MPRQKPKQWVRVATPPPVAEAEKRAIIEACEAFIRDVLKPKFLPEISPTTFNYVVDIRGAWAAGRFRFFQRFRSDAPDRDQDGFDQPFARLDRMGPDLFDVQWMRHTGTWWPLHRGLTLADALRMIETDDRLHPL